jgi:hypothetical protein
VLVVGPFVAFQALLCARDDYQMQHNTVPKLFKPSATDVVAPLLIFVGVVWIIVTLVSFTTRTAFQVRTCRFFCVPYCRITCVIRV